MDSGSQGEVWIAPRSEAAMCSMCRSMASAISSEYLFTSFGIADSYVRWSEDL